ncbi:hypothetical protein Dimus_035602 [Dionaea muscipula]
MICLPPSCRHRSVRFFKMTPPRLLALRRRRWSSGSSIPSVTDGSSFGLSFQFVWPDVGAQSSAAASSPLPWTSFRVFVPMSPPPSGGPSPLQPCGGVIDAVSATWPWLMTMRGRCFLLGPVLPQIAPGQHVCAVGSALSWDFDLLGFTLVGSELI